MNICRLLIRTLHQEHQDSQPSKAGTIETLNAAFLELETLLDTANAELTSIEASSARIHLELGKAWLRRHRFKSQDTEDDETLAEPATVYIEEWLRDITEEFSDPPPPGLPGPSWEFLHRAFSTLDTLISISLFLATDSQSRSRESRNKSNSTPQSKSNSKSKAKAKVSTNMTSPSSYSDNLSPTQAQTLADLISGAEKNIHASARAYRNVLTESAALDPLLDAIFAYGHGNGAEEHIRENGDGENDHDADDHAANAGNANAGGGDNADDAVESKTDSAGVGIVAGKYLSDLPDAQAVAEKLCSEIKDCWVEVLDGILRVRVTVGKP